MNPARRTIEVVSAAFGVPASTIMGPCRKRRVAFARFAVYALMRARGLSLTQIGRALGVDHTSVIHGLRRVAEMDERWREGYAKAKSLLGEAPALAWRVVYPRPIGPPVPPRALEKPAAPKPLTHDDVWAAKMRGARFRSVRAVPEGMYREALPDCAREI